MIATSPVVAIRKTLELLHEPGCVFEMRLLETRYRTVSGYYNDPDAFARDAARWDGDANIYATVNPVNPVLLARSPNKLTHYAKHTTNDKDIARRRWLPVDFDAIRPAGISSSDEEHEAAIDRAKACARWPVSQGWPKPILGDSGNGGHLLFRIDEPGADDGLVKRALGAMALHFADEAITVDLTSATPARIWKVYGTKACKGADVPERPHRYAQVLYVDAGGAGVVSRAQLEALAATLPQPEPTARQTGHGTFDLDALLARAGSDLGGPVPYDGGRKWVFSRCPWNPDHTDRSAFVIQFGNGAVAAGCHHNGCQGKNWHDLRDILDPGWRDFRARDSATFTVNGHSANGHSANGHGEVPGAGADTPAGQVPNLTDVGNGRRLVARHGRDLLYCDRFKAWLIWDGQRFGRDETGEIARRAKETVRAMYAHAGTIPDDDARTALIKWALKSEAGPKIREMIGAAQTEEGIAVAPAVFDADPWLLSVANGTLDLRTGTLRQADRADRLTKLAPVVYDPAAACPTWLAFLDRIMNGKQEVIDFLQRAVGYSLTGDISEHCLFLLFGTGRNGKSTFVETLSAALGDYALTTSTDTLLVQRAGGIPNDIARLVGARLVSASESEAGRNFAEALVKQLTGGDTISARFLHAEFFDFRPSFKLWFRTNHKPTIKGSDDGIWARIRLVPFTQRIPDGEIDKRLPERLLAELPGILAWAVQGCLLWQRDGLGMPTDVAKATAEYRSEMDVIGSFIADCCTVGSEYRCTAKELYAAYAKWAEESGERVMSQKALSLRLIERNFVNAKGSGGTRMWSGLKVAGGG